MEVSSVIKKKKLPTVPVTSFKGRIKKNINETKRQRRRRERKLTKSKENWKEEALTHTLKKTQGRTKFVRPERFIKRCNQQENEDKRIRRTAQKAAKSVKAAEEPKLGFVIRLKGSNGIHPKIRKVLKLLNLPGTNTGNFVKLNKVTTMMLRIAEPVVTWGFPNMKSVKDLIYKRGTVYLGARKKSLTSNSIIESKFGHLGIICMEDLVHEIYNMGPHFTEVTDFLSHFKFKSNVFGEKWQKTFKHFIKGGDYGNRGNQLNVLLRRIV